MWIVTWGILTNHSALFQSRVITLLWNFFMTKGPGFDRQISGFRTIPQVTIPLPLKTANTSFFKIILFSIFVIFNNFHKQHKCNNRLTNNSINNCSFCFLFTPSFLKVFPSVYVMLEPKKNGRHQGLTSRPRAQRTNVHCSWVWSPLSYPGAPANTS